MAMPVEKTAGRVAAPAVPSEPEIIPACAMYRLDLKSILDLRQNLFRLVLDYSKKRLYDIVRRV
jgi:hypothetical protein